MLIQQTKTLHQKNTAPQADSDIDEVFTPEHHRRRRAVDEMVSDPVVRSMENYISQYLKNAVMPRISNDVFVYTVCVCVKSLWIMTFA